MTGYVETGHRANAGRRAGARSSTVSVAMQRIVGSTRFYDLTPWDWSARSPGSESRQRHDRPDVASIGYTWLEPRAQRTPINTEAKLLMMDHAFETVGGMGGAAPDRRPQFRGRGRPSNDWAPASTACSGPTCRPPTARYGTRPSSPCWRPSGPPTGSAWASGWAPEGLGRDALRGWKVEGVGARFRGRRTTSDRITPVYISAKVDYAVRALCTLADAGERPVTAESLAQSQGLPAKFLESILNDMRRAGLLLSQRGAEGGYRLSRPASSITVADVIRPLDGPLAEVRGLRPEAANYEGAAEHLQTVWIAVRASLRLVLEQVSIADIVSGALPQSVNKLTTDPDAWLSR